MYFCVLISGTPCNLENLISYCVCSSTYALCKPVPVLYCLRYLLLIPRTQTSETYSNYHKLYDSVLETVRPEHNHLLNYLTLLVPSASSVSSLKLASADWLHRDHYEICILYLFFVTACRRQGSP